jgi:hypothetical protein
MKTLPLVERVKQIPVREARYVPTKPHCSKWKNRLFDQNR